MPRLAGPLVVGIWLTIPAMCGAAEPLPPLQQALALQKAMQQVIRNVEPAIACILVSRSEAYQRFGHGPSLDQPGKLGGFPPDFFDQHGGLSTEEQRQLRKKLDLADPDHVPESFGSGVVIDEQGLVLTNYHVVRDAAKVFVRLPGNRASYADIHAADPRSDLAVLRLLTPKKLLKALPLGDGGKVERGQFVLSIAHPFAAGFRDGQPSASWGIISNVRRRVSGLTREEDRVQPLHHYGILLQTDARLHLGCSGGVLVTLEGEVIGLTTALAAIQGGETPGGYAIPFDAGLRRIVAVLQRGEEVEYGFLGVSFIPMEGGNGVVLDRVIDGSPASLEGKLRSGDRLLAVNGTPIRDSDDLFLHLGTMLAGGRVRLDVRRALGPVQTVDVTLAKFLVPGKKITSSLGGRPWFRGLRVDYTSILVQQHFPRPLQRIPVGVLITEVQANGPAARAPLKVGEIITHVNGRPVSNPSTFYQEVAKAQGAVECTLYPSSPREPAMKVLLKDN